MSAPRRPAGRPTPRGQQRGLRPTVSAQQTETAAAAAAGDPPAPRRTTLTSRAAVLGVVLLVLGLSFAYPLRNWYAQRAEIADVRDAHAAQQQEVDNLRAQIDRWDDPAYVAAVARERLHFVKPGETLYVVLADDDPAPESADAEITAGGSEWWERLWATVEEADSTPDGQP